MNHCLSPHHSLRMTHAFALALFFAISPFAYGGPGAHGPNGEHLDGPVAATSGNGSATPRLEAHSEDFELVATLGGGCKARIAANRHVVLRIGRVAQIQHKACVGNG